jgi:hypothetical protein
LGRRAGADAAAQAQPVSAQVKKGLARAVAKFDAYQLASTIATARAHRDVSVSAHAKPKDADQAQVWKELGRRHAQGRPRPGRFAVVRQGQGGDLRASIAEKKLGGLALLRNLRLMQKAGVAGKTIAGAIDAMRVDRILPYRFIAARAMRRTWSRSSRPRC